MKNLADICEGILGNDLDDTIETSAYDSRIEKLAEKWRAKDYKGDGETDMFGNELHVGDWVMRTEEDFVEFGQILNIDWSKQKPLMISCGNSRPFEKSCAEVAKLEPKQAYNILKELCAH